MAEPVRRCYPIDRRSSQESRPPPSPTQALTDTQTSATGEPETQSRYAAAAALHSPSRYLFRSVYAILSMDLDHAIEMITQKRGRVQSGTGRNDGLCAKRRARASHVSACSISSSSQTSRHDGILSLVFSRHSCTHIQRKSLCVCKERQKRAKVWTTHTQQKEKSKKKREYDL